MKKNFYVTWICIIVMVTIGCGAVYFTCNGNEIGQADSPDEAETKSQYLDSIEADEFTLNFIDCFEAEDEGNKYVVIEYEIYNYSNDSVGIDFIDTVVNNKVIEQHYNAEIEGQGSLFNNCCDVSVRSNGYYKAQLQIPLTQLKGADITEVYVHYTVGKILSYELVEYIITEDLIINRT